MNSALAQNLHRVWQVKNVIQTRWVMRQCDSLGRLARITEGNVVVRNEGKMTIGARTRLFGRFVPIDLRTGPGGVLEIGEQNVLRCGLSISAASSVRLGDGVQIGPNCIISDVDVGGLDSPDTAPPRPVTIGDGVWLATRVIVRAGSTIGEGAVIGAGSIVDGDIPAWSVATGSPAKVVRMLDAAETSFTRSFA